MSGKFQDYPEVKQNHCDTFMKRFERFLKPATFVPPFRNTDWLMRICEIFYWLSLLSLLSPELEEPHARGGMKIDKKRGTRSELLLLVYVRRRRTLSAMVGIQKTVISAG